MKNTLHNMLILVCVSMLTLVGCSSNTQSENTGIGAVTGAVVGGLAGSAFGGGTGQVVAIGVGALAGALLGGVIGHSMESSDNQQMCNTMNNNPVNKPHHWKNKSTGANYTMTPTSNMMTYNGNSQCRRYTSTAIISGKEETMSGIACRQSDGTWKEINS